MPDFLKVERPFAPPTQCIICTTHGCPDGFIDTGREIPGYGVLGGNAGRVYVCGWCIASAAKLQGFVDPDVHARVLDDLRARNETIVELEAQLTEERDKKLVSLTDLEQVLSKRKLTKAASS